MPETRLKIGFFARRSLPIHARSIEERPLGGTETGVIRLAEELSKRGHDVTVFTSHAEPPKSTPRYLPYPQLSSAGTFDIFVAVQEWWPVFFGVQAQKKFFWTGDGFDQHINFGLGDKRVAARLDGLLTVSDWQGRTLSEKSNFPLEKCHFIGNGVHLPYFETSSASDPEAVRTRRKKLIYSSAPYRGLQLMPSIYRTLKRAHPDLELHVFAGMNIYDRDKPYEGPMARDAQQLAEIMRTIPGCVMHGNVIQRELARELLGSGVFVYPNIIFETCCITALEAQAAGCPVVASRNSALPETVGDAGLLIDGTPGSDIYCRAFTESVNLLLTDEVLWRRLSERGRERIKKEYTWANVADRFEKVW